MLRVKIGAKFPSRMPPTVMRDILMSIVADRLDTNGILPDQRDVQRSISRISDERCTRSMYVHVWVNEQTQINTLQHRSRPKPKPKKKLTKKTKDFFDTLPKVSCKDACSICLKEKFKGVRLPCGHVFHKSCIKKSCQYDKRCPNCRKEITS